MVPGRHFKDDHPDEYKVLYSISQGYHSVMYIARFNEGDVNLTEIDIPIILKKLKSAGLITSQLHRGWDPVAGCTSRHNRYQLTSLGMTCIMFGDD